LIGSPAIDAGSLDCPPPARDQRGYGRPVDGDSDDQAICDIGAFEFGAVPLTRPTNLLTTVGDANGNSSADYAVTTLSDDNVGMYWQDGADGSAIGEVDLGDQELRLLETLADISGNGLDEVMTLTIANDQKRIVRLFDSGHGMPIRQLPFGRGAHYPIALLALDNADGGLAGRAVAVVQPDDEGRARAIVRDALTGEKIKTVRYGLTIGTPIGAVRIADLNGNAVEEIAVFGETTEGQAKVQIRDALSGEKLATFGFDRHFRPMLVGSIPPVNGDDSDELVVVGVNDAGAVRIEVKDSLTKQRLTTRWLRRIEEEVPLAMGYVDHPEGPALTILTEGADGKYRGRTKRLTSTEAGWLVDVPPVDDLYYTRPQDVPRRIEVSERSEFQRRVAHVRRAYRSALIRARDLDERWECDWRERQVGPRHPPRRRRRLLEAQGGAWPMVTRLLEAQGGPWPMEGAMHRGVELLRHLAAGCSCLRSGP
jgi:hypothetical protein